MARFDSRTRSAGWLPPSLMSIINNVKHWVKKLMALCPITHVHIESVRFDLQKMVTLKLVVLNINKVS